MPYASGQTVWMGHATKDMEVQTSKSGKDFGRFGLAISRRGDYEKTTFWAVTVFGKMAEKEIHKGDLIMLLDPEPAVEESEDGKRWPVLVGGVVINLEDWRQRKNEKSNGNGREYAAPEGGETSGRAPWDPENPPF